MRANALALFSVIGLMSISMLIANKRLYCIIKENNRIIFKNFRGRSMERLYKMVQGYFKRFPDGVVTS